MYFLNCQIFDKANTNIFFQGQLYGDLNFSSWASSPVLHESLRGCHSTLRQMKEILTAAWASSWAGSSARPFRKTDESRDWSHCLSVRGEWSGRPRLARTPGWGPGTSPGCGGPGRGPPAQFGSSPQPLVGVVLTVESVGSFQRVLVAEDALGVGGPGV